VRIRIGSIAALLLAIPQPALAQNPGRELVVAQTSAWQHAETQIILPPRVTGLTRSGLRDLGDGEMDVVVQYEGGADGVFATVYLFRTQSADVPLWFDRALTAIMTRPEHGFAGAAPAPVPFTRPGAAVASGLRATIDIAWPGLRSTGIAIAPLGPYLVKVRMSSATLDRAALDERLSRFVEGLRWPAPLAGERAAEAILPCPEPLRLRNARLVRTAAADSLMDAISGVVVAEREDRPPPPVYCREPGATLQYGVYRPNRSRDSYLIALNDAGIALSVDEAVLAALLGQGGGRRYVMTLLGRDSTSVLPSFNRLPPPEQAVSVAFGNRGDTISVSVRDPQPPR
jgi:hypothetical protein